jgi:hypothetical protein
VVVAGSPPLPSLKGMAGRPKLELCQCCESCLQSPLGAQTQSSQIAMASLVSICCQHFAGNQVLGRQIPRSQQHAFTSLNRTGKGSARSARSEKSIDLG